MGNELDKEAIVEGLLCVVGEEGLKIENIASVPRDRCLKLLMLLD